MAGERCLAATSSSVTDSMVPGAWGRFMTGVPTLVDITGAEKSRMAAREGDPPARATTGSRAASGRRFSV